MAGSPAPTVQWQRLVDGTWTDVPGATGTTLAFTAHAVDSGDGCRPVALLGVGLLLVAGAGRQRASVANVSHAAIEPCS